MEETQLRNFLSVLECGSISRAAEALGIAQPSLSQQMLRFEDELKMTLFVRSTRGVSLTEIGRAFEPHAREILHSMQRAREYIGAYEAVPHGAVSFVVPSSINQLLGAPLTVACRERFPDISLKMQEGASGSLRTMIMANGLDLAISFCSERAPPSSPWRHRWLANETLLIVGRAGEFGPVDSRGIAVQSVGPETFRRKDLIVPSVPRSGRLNLQEDTASYAFGFRVGIEIDSLSQILTLVAAGEGYSMMSHAAIRDDLRSGRVSAARVHGVNLTRSVSVARNSSRPITRALLKVEDLVFTMLQQMIADGVWVTDIHALPEARPAEAATPCIHCAEPISPPAGRRLQ
ncbi:MAG: hypothetical protein JWO33_2614 [Caulobacteraceae bacterium]|nr:hypothetical protein [Caulobacteraceae bacterium]